MTYSIIGSGAIGTALARQFSRKGIDVLVANTRGPASIQPLVAELGETIRPASVAEATGADIVILALPYAAVGSMAEGRDWNGRVVIDATNAIDFSDFSPLDLGGARSTEIVAGHLPGARVVKGFNTLPAAVLASEPQVGDRHRVIFLSGDSEEANEQASALVRALGFEPILLGTIADGGKVQEFGGPLMVHSLLK
jgi:predicted dinucleotide-binding enzyme